MMSEAQTNGEAFLPFDKAELKLMLKNLDQYTDDEVVEMKLQCYLSNSHLVFPPPHSITINLLMTLFAEFNKTLTKLRMAFCCRHTASIVLQFACTYSQCTYAWFDTLKT